MAEAKVLSDDLEAVFAGDRWTLRVWPGGAVSLDVFTQTEGRRYWFYETPAIRDLSAALWEVAKVREGVLRQRGDASGESTGDGEDPLQDKENRA